MSDPEGTRAHLVGPVITWVDDATERDCSMTNTLRRLRLVLTPKAAATPAVAISPAPVVVVRCGFENWVA